METVKLMKTLLLLGIHLLWIVPLSLQDHLSRNHENVIDLLAALNMSHPIKGVSRVLGEHPGTLVYKLRSRAPYLTLPREYSHFLVSTLQGSMGVHLVARQTLDSSATLLSFYSASSPILQIFSSTHNDVLRLDYQAGTGARGLTSLHVPGGNPFSGTEWVQLALGLEPDRVTLFVDCQEAVVLQRKTEERINLVLPQDLVVTLASTPGEKNSKFVGYVKTAEISMRAYLRRPWHCVNVTDALLPSRYTDTLSRDSWADSSQIFHLDASNSKLQTPHRAQHQPSHYSQELQKDQPLRSTALGPSGSPGTKSGSQAQEAQEKERLRGLEQRLEELARMLDMVKVQNADLQSRVQYLEGCECVRQRCVWEGREMENGQHWQTDLNAVCTCTSGKVICQDNIKDPCLSSPCQNGGVCSVSTSDPAGFHCSCPPNTKGPLCHSHTPLRQACWTPRPENNCQGVQSIQRHWAFNPTSGLCEEFLYCTGNSSNNFPSLSACRDQCMLGACCIRKSKQDLSTSRQDYSQHGYNISYVDSAFGGYDLHSLEDEIWYSNIDFNLTELEDGRERERKEGWKKDQDSGRVDCSEDPDFVYTCEYVSVRQCQVLVKDLAGEGVSFSPGGKCSEVSCGGGCGCISQRQLWRYGERFRQGCEECICTRGGKVDCVCTYLTQRKEIRDLTLRERKLYQRAIRKLHTKPGVWEGFALLRAEFSPQAGAHPFFLPWHRYFLRLVERELQSLSSCQLAVPYFEWTVDSGSMRTSAAWQAGLFGGDGESGSGCVPHHPFQNWASRSRWSPCLRRSFNSSVWLPDAVTLQRIVNQGDFQLLSQSLQTFSGLFRLWVGGHMASPLAAYDPLYLSHMAFIDKLWTQWQEKHQHADAQIYKDSQTPRGDVAQSNIHYPARQRHVKMKPFDVTPDDVMSSQKHLCVVYVPITIGAPCNVTSLHTHPLRSDYTDDYSTPRYGKHGFDKHSSYQSGFDSSVFDSSGFDSQGYDRDGFDHSGWDRWGYGRDGLNRDFIDRDGYDASGFNRYGFNRSNVTWFGMSYNGTFEKEKERDRGEDSGEKTEVQKDKIMSELFSDRGYSIYGFDPFGLDRAGFDAYGFRTDGYDKDSCNWFFNGPHYLRFYFHTQQQLMSSSTQALNRITRTCPPISSLPQHWTLQDWMTLDPEESRVLIDRLEQEWVGQKTSESEDSVMEPGQNSRDIWLPVTPDHRLCFKLHWFSGCHLGSAPITCPDLCLQARCHGYPEAVCHMHNCGSCFTEWLDPATGSHVICHDW